MKVAIETTSRCNLACAMCGHPVMTRRKADMPFDLFTKVADDIKAHGHQLWQLHLFGEPLVDALCEQRIKYLADNDMPVRWSFSTNCMLLTPERTEELIDAGFCEVYKHAKVVRLCIDSMIPEVYDKLRIGGDHGLAVDNAMNFIHRTRGLIDNVTVQRMLTQHNVRESERAYSVFGVPIRTQKVGRHQDKTRDLRGVKNNSDRRKSCKLMFCDAMWVASDGRTTSCCLDCDILQPYGDLTRQTIDEARLSDERALQMEQFEAGHYSDLAQCNICYGNECTGRW